MKKNIIYFFIAFIVVLIVVLIIKNLVVVLKDDKITNINVNGTTKNKIENTFANDIKWNIEFSDIPKFEAPIIDYKYQNEYSIYYYKNISEEFINNYIELLKTNGFSIEKNVVNNGDIQYTVNKNQIKIEIHWENTKNLEMKMIRL